MDTWILWTFPRVTALISRQTIDCVAEASHDWGQQTELCQKSYKISACADLSATKAIGADQISNPIRPDWAKHVNLDLRRPEFDFTRGRTFLLGFTWCHVIRYLIQLLQQNYQTVIDDWFYSTRKYIYMQYESVSELSGYVVVVWRTGSYAVPSETLCKTKSKL